MSKRLSKEPIYLSRSKKESKYDVRSFFANIINMQSHVVLKYN